MAYASWRGFGCGFALRHNAPPLLRSLAPTLNCFQLLRSPLSCAREGLLLASWCGRCSDRTTTPLFRLICKCTILDSEACSNTAGRSPRQTHPVVLLFTGSRRGVTSWQPWQETKQRGTSGLAVVSGSGITKPLSIGIAAPEFDSGAFLCFAGAAARSRRTRPVGRTRAHCFARAARPAHTGGTV